MQPVLPQNRPDHPAGASRFVDWPDASSNPPSLRRGHPAFDKTPGHTVYVQLFTNVNVVADAMKENLQEVMKMKDRNKLEGQVDSMSENEWLDVLQILRKS